MKVTLNLMGNSILLGIAEDNEVWLSNLLPEEVIGELDTIGGGLLATDFQGRKVDSDYLLKDGDVINIDSRTERDWRLKLEVVVNEFGETLPTREYVALRQFLEERGYGSLWHMRVSFAKAAAQLHSDFDPTIHHF